MNDIEVLSSRIERLEREVCRGRRLRSVLLVVAGSLLVVAFQKPMQEGVQAKIIQAREFQLVDEKGAIRGRLGPDQEKPAAVSLTLNRNGVDEDVRLRSGPGQPELLLDGGDDSGAVWLGVSGSSAHLALLTPGGGTKTAVVSLGARELIGSLIVSKMKEVEVQGDRGVVVESSFRWPADASEGAKSGK